jgi:signal transduction histidine kinase
MIFNYPPEDRSLEVNIVLSFTKSTVIITALYAVYDLFQYDYDAGIKAGITMLVYSAMYALILCTKGARVVIKTIMAMYMLSVLGGFFFQGGMFNINGFDMFALVIAITFVFNGNDRIVFLSLYTVQILAVSYIQVSHPEWISNVRDKDPMLMNLAEIFARILNVLYIIYLYKKEFERERRRVFETNEKLEQANAEVYAQNEVIASYNRSLEVLVDDRTKDIQSLNQKLIEYAFFNSHKVRGPLARILGLIYLIRLTAAVNQDGNIRSIDDQITMLEKSATELDDVIKAITVLLDEETKDILEYRTALSTPKDNGHLAAESVS